MSAKTDYARALRPPADASEPAQTDALALADYIEGTADYYALQRYALDERTFLAELAAAFVAGIEHGTAVPQRDLWATIRKAGLGL